jgi:Zn-dependent protease with chaperone function
MSAGGRLSIVRVGLLLACLSFGFFAVVESVRVSTLMSEVDPAMLLPMTVISSYDANNGGLSRDYRLVGRLPRGSRAITVKATTDLVSSHGPGFTVGVYPTYRADEPYVTQAAYESAQPLWRLGGVTLNWFAALGGAFIAGAGYVLIWRRGALRVRETGGEAGNDRFTALSSRFETQVRSLPGLYKLRLLGLALLGYGFLTAVLAGVVLTLAVLAYLVFAGHAAVVAKLLIPLAVLIYAIVRALWVRLPPPDGIALTPQNAPGLFGFLRELRRAARGPRIHRVLLNEDMNASIVQIPRLGVFGWHRNYLVIGLPILQALTPQQAKAVIAHEFGHLAGAHGKFSSWIYRIRKTWAQLAEQIAARSQWSAFIFRGFFGWYVPYFNAYSFALARANEYEADRLAAEIAGAEHAGAALIGVEMKAQRLSQKFWVSLQRQVERLPEPEVPPHTAMGRFFASADGTGGQDELQTLLKRETGFADTHPSLADRLKALGVAPQPAAPVAESAAVAFLGEALPELVQQMDMRWRSWAMPRWQQGYSEAAAARSDFQALQEKARLGPLDLSERRDLAKLTERFEDGAAAEPLYRALLVEHPADVVANYFLGRLLLSRGDEGGIALINAAMDVDASAVLPGCDLIFGYLQDQGRIEEAARYRERWIERHDLLQHDQSERSHLAERDRLLPHRLASEALADLVEQLRERREVQRAYLVEKEMTAFPERPLLIIALQTALWPASRNVPPDLESILGRELRLPNEVLIVRLDWRQHRLLKKVKRVPAALIFRR